MNSIAATTFPAYRSNVAICPAGERGGKLLPKLLKPGELASKEQKEVFRKENGIEGLGDIGRLIEVTVSLFIDRLPFFVSVGSTTETPCCIHCASWQRQSDDVS